MFKCLFNCFQVLLHYIYKNSVILTWNPRSSIRSLGYIHRLRIFKVPRKIVWIFMIRILLKIIHNWLILPNFLNLNFHPYFLGTTNGVQWQTLVSDFKIYFEFWHKKIVHFLKNFAKFMLVF